MNTTATKEVQPYLSWGFDNDSEDTSFAWDCLCDELTALMGKINKGGNWHCQVENFGWQCLNGYKDFRADTGQALLSNTLPNTECHFRIFVEGKGFGRYLKIQNFHHDSPTGKEWYTVRRA